MKGVSGVTNEEMAAALASVESRSKSNTHRLDEMERRQDDLDELVSSVKVLAVRQEAVESDVKEIKNDVKALSGKPAQRWDAMVDKLCWAVLAAIASFLLTRIGIV